MNTMTETLSGEMLHRRRERRSRTIRLSLFVIGAIEGGFAGWYLAEGDFRVDAAWPAPLAIALALGYVVAILAGAWLLRHSVDELERAQQHKAVTFAAAVYVMVYPVWFLLWKGGIAGEPVHWLLFVMFWLSLAAATLYQRLR